MTEPVRTSRLPARLRNLDPRQRLLLFVLAIVAVAAVLFLLLSGGGGGIEGVNTTPVVRNPSASPSPTVSSPPETGQAFEGKDPFQPLVVAVAPGPSGTPAPAPTGSVAPVGGGGSGTATTVTLIDIRKQNGKLEATLDVNGKDYTAAAGETFAGSFRVVSLNSSCGTFVFGDERFSLCVGQEVRK
ncbi:MAG: hypothetical protein ACXVQV_06905 [Actinomycetota bacterium]